MKNKGFTLIELLGIIIILGVIALIAIPAIGSLTRQNEERLYKVQLDSIKSGLKTWGDANSKFLPVDNKSITINLGILKLSGFADEDIENPLEDNACFPNELPLTIKNNRTTYEYIVDDKDLDLYDNTCNGAPSKSIAIILQGDDAMDVRIGESYTEPGYLVIDETGMAIKANVSIIVTNSSGVTTTLNTSVAGSYDITYSYNSVSATRKLIVR